MQRILVDTEPVSKLMMLNDAFSPRTVLDGVQKEAYPGTRWENIQLLPSIRRYSIGSQRPGLTPAPDGSLTLCIQHQSPGAHKEAIWLPAPAGPLDAHLRTYVPRAPLKDGSYRLPPIERQELSGV
jgi:hypothetical protein